MWNEICEAFQFQLFDMLQLWLAPATGCMLSTKIKSNQPFNFIDLDWLYTLVAFYYIEKFLQRHLGLDKFKDKLRYGHLVGASVWQFSRWGS